MLSEHNSKLKFLDHLFADGMTCVTDKDFDRLAFTAKGITTRKYIFSTDALLEILDYLELTTKATEIKLYCIQLEDFTDVYQIKIDFFLSSVTVVLNATSFVPNTGIQIAQALFRDSKWDVSFEDFTTGRKL